MDLTNHLFVCGVSARFGEVVAAAASTSRAAATIATAAAEAVAAVASFCFH